MTTLAQIVYEQGHHWVKKLSTGRYEVYRNELTHAVRCSQVSYPNDDAKALKRALQECSRRES
jgi:hypothetical protein